MDKILNILWFLTVAVAMVHSQTTLQYDIFEETQLPLSIANLFSASNLRDAYTAEQVATMSLEIAEQESNLHEFFSITATGMLQVSSRLDRDVICRNARTCQINLDIQVQPFEFFQIIKVEVSIMDTNDNTPSFGDTNSQHVLAITEGPASDIPQSLPQATDPDSPTNSVVRYEISGERNNFELQTFTAVDGTIEPLLRVLVPLDRETTSQYSLILYAIDVIHAVGTSTRRSFHTTAAYVVGALQILCGVVCVVCNYVLIATPIKSHQSKRDIFKLPFICFGLSVSSISV